MGSSALIERRQQRSGFVQGMMAAGVALAAILLATSPGCGGTDPVQPDGGTVCNQGDKSCPDGTRCTSRNCVPTCEGGGACPTGSYCEAPQGPVAVCSPVTPISCSRTLDCPAPQTCSGGICTSLELREDGGTQGCVLAANDHCAPDSVCYQQFNSTGLAYNLCLGLPHCGQDGTCPVGNRGTTCNQLPDGGFVFPGKERLCLYGFCADASNCPLRTNCFRYAPTDQLGQCKAGTAGDPCLGPDDCTNARYCQLADGGVNNGGPLADGGVQLGTCVQ
jgi:hypothetical protein